MNYHDLTKTRHSVRGYHPEKEVSKEVLLRILEAGRLAPSAHNNQPWTFVVITSEEMLKAVHEAYDRVWFHEAPVVLAVVGRYSEAWERKYDGYNSLETDLTIAMDHLIMAATEEGLGTCWIAAFDPKVLRTALKLETDEVVYAITPLGFPKEYPLSTKKKIRKTLDEVVKWV